MAKGKNITINLECLTKEINVSLNPFVGKKKNKKILRQVKKQIQKVLSDSLG